MMEQEIGTRITIEVVRDTDGEGCGQCFFNQLDECPLEIQCGSLNREDGEGVYYHIVSIYPKKSLRK